MTYGKSLALLIHVAALLGFAGEFSSIAFDVFTGKHSLSVIQIGAFEAAARRSKKEILDAGKGKEADLLARKLQAEYYQAKF